MPDFVITTTWIILLVIYVSLLCLFVRSLLDFRRHHDVFPFERRVKPAIMFMYGTVLFQLVNLFMKQLYVDTTCKLTLDCPRYGVYRLLYGISVPLVAFAAILRAYVLIFKYGVRDAVKEMEQRKELDLNNFYVKHRHWLKDAFITKVLACFTAFVVVSEVGIYASGNGGENMSRLLLFAHGLASLLLLQSPIVVYMLRNRVKDNLGITKELKYVAGFSVFGMMFYTAFSSRFPEITNEASVGDFFLYLVWANFWYWSLHLPLSQIDRDAVKEQKRVVEQGRSILSRAVRSSRYSRMSRTTGAIGISSVFKTVKCHIFTFTGILRSEEGYGAFLDFLGTEFATENLEFWKAATELRAHISESIAKTLMNKGRHGGINVGAANNSVLSATHSHESKSKTHSKTHSRSFQQLPSTSSFQETNSAVTVVSSSGVDIGTPRSALKTRSVAPMVPACVQEGVELSDTKSAKSRSNTDNNNVDSEITGGLPGQPSMGEDGEVNDCRSPVIVLRSPIMSGGGRKFLSPKPSGSSGDCTPEATDEQILIDMDGPPELYLPYMERCRVIYNRFCTANSIQQVNLKGKVYAEVAESMNILDALVCDDEVTSSVGIMSTKDVFLETQSFLQQSKDVFKPALKEIMFLLEKDSFVRFLKSPMYAELKEGATNELDMPIDP